VSEVPVQIETLRLLSHSSLTNRCTFIETLIKFTLKLDGSYMFPSTTVLGELAIEPG